MTMARGEKIPRMRGLQTIGFTLLCARFVKFMIIALISKTFLMHTIKIYEKKNIQMLLHDEVICFCILEYFGVYNNSVSSYESFPLTLLARCSYTCGNFLESFCTHNMLLVVLSHSPRYLKLKFIIFMSGLSLTFARRVSNRVFRHTYHHHHRIIFAEFHTHRRV